MLRSLVIAAALAATALPAVAASVTVDINGLDRAAAHAKIEKAAAEACRVALSDETPLVQYYRAQRLHRRRGLRRRSQAGRNQPHLRQAVGYVCSSPVKLT